MKTKEEIAEYIRNHRPWTAEKERKLIAEEGGFTTWGDDYFMTDKYLVVVDEIERAMGILAKESTIDPNEFAKEMRNYGF